MNQLRKIGKQFKHQQNITKTTYGTYYAHLGRSILI